MYLYKAFGISVKSEVLIPQFNSTENRQIDAFIKFGEVRELLPSAGKIARVARISSREICFYWSRIGWFLVRNGDEIVVEPETGAAEKLISLALIGVVFATLLQQRGMLVLHASAVAVEGAAVAFLGQKGKGKSTTAALLHQRGHPVISDDVVAVRFAESGLPSVAPGFPSFKLLPDTISALGDDPAALTQCYDGAEKRFRSFSDNFSHEEIPLKAVFCLAESKKIQSKLLEPQQAVTTLIANTYLARYGEQMFLNGEAITNLRQCSNIVNRIPVYHLERPKSFHRLKEFAELIELQSTAA